MIFVLKMAATAVFFSFKMQYICLIKGNILGKAKIYVPICLQSDIFRSEPTAMALCEVIALCLGDFIIHFFWNNAFYYVPPAESARSEFTDAWLAVA